MREKKLLRPSMVRYRDECGFFNYPNHMLGLSSGPYRIVLATLENPYERVTFAWTNEVLVRTGLKPLSRPTFNRGMVQLRELGWIVDDHVSDQNLRQYEETWESCKRRGLWMERGEKEEPSEPVVHDAIPVGNFQVGEISLSELQRSSTSRH